MSISIMALSILIPRRKATMPAAFAKGAVCNLAVVIRLELVQYLLILRKRLFILPTTPFLLPSIIMAVVTVPNTTQQGLKIISADMHQMFVVAGFEIDTGKTS